MKDRLRGLPVIGTAIRMQERYVDDAADALAASIGFFGFLSLFPLLALVLGIVGATIGDSAVEQQRVVELVTESVPGLSALVGGDGQVAQAIQSISDSTGPLFGFATIGLVLSGLRIASGAQQASAVVFRRQRPTGLGARVEQVRALVVVGLFTLAGAAVSGSVGIDIGTGLDALALSLVGIAVAFGIDVVMFLLAYRLFTPGSGPDWRTLVPGSLLAAAGWVALKVVGTTYISRQATSAQATYGALGSVIALLLLLYLAGRLYLYGAELAALLGHIDDAPEATGPARSPSPEASPRPHPDVPPEPADAAKLAVSGVVLGLAGSVLAKLLRR